MTLIALWSRLLDLISPRCCAVCGRRLFAGESDICVECVVALPRTDFVLSPKDNDLARFFWGLMPIERATALFYYRAHSETSNIIYSLKYHGQASLGVALGRIAAREAMGTDFFEGVDMIVPVPLARKRERQRGYNQSEMIAEGISEMTGIGMRTDVVKRTKFLDTQTKLSRWERQENVKGLFKLIDAESIRGKHVLLVDDVVTTGATINACAEAMMAAGDVRFSVMVLGFSHS